MTRKDKGTMVPVILLMALCWVVISWMDDDPEVEKKVETMNITSVETVCQGGWRVWAVRYGDAGWFTTNKPYGHGATGIVFDEKCDGSETLYTKIDDKED